MAIEEERKVKKKLIISILVIILISGVAIGIYSLVTKKGEKTMYQDKITENQNTQQEATFNFETKTVTLNSGYEMPLNGIGTYSLTGDVCYVSIMSALESGVRLIDTAYMYNNEEEIGRAIKDSNIDRKELFITTKLYPNQYSNPEEAIEMALEKLDVEYIDLLLLHHPGTNDVKAYQVMEEYVRKGKNTFYWFI